jgi:hypothetical protein
MVCGRQILFLLLFSKGDEALLCIVSSVIILVHFVCQPCEIKCSSDGEHLIQQQKLPRLQGSQYSRMSYAYTPNVFEGNENQHPFLIGRDPLTEESEYFSKTSIANVSSKGNRTIDHSGHSYYEPDASSLVFVSSEEPNYQDSSGAPSDSNSSDVSPSGHQEQDAPGDFESPYQRVDHDFNVFPEGKYHSPLQAFSLD